MSIPLQLAKTKTDDKLELHGLHSQNSDKKIIIYVHGYSSEFYSDWIASYFLNNLKSNDPSFISTENRGGGGIKYMDKNRERYVAGSAYETFEDCVHDIKAWIDWAEEQGFEEIWTMSHSLGPSKVVYYSTETQDIRIKGHIFLSPSEMYGLVREPIGILEYESMYPEAKKLVENGNGEQILSMKLWEYNYISARTYLNLFEEGTNAAIFNYFKPELGWDRVNKIDVPVLAITGSEDDGIVSVIDAHKAMSILVKQLKNSPRVETVTYDGAKHDFTGFYDVILEKVIGFIGG